MKKKNNKDIFKEIKKEEKTIDDILNKLTEEIKKLKLNDVNKEIIYKI